MFQLATYAVFIDQFYTKVLTAPQQLFTVILSAKLQPNCCWNKKLTRILRFSLNRICRIAQPLDKNN